MRRERSRVVINRINFANLSAASSLCLVDCLALLELGPQVLFLLNRLMSRFDSKYIWLLKKSISPLKRRELNYGMLQLVSEREFYLVLYI